MTLIIDSLSRLDHQAGLFLEQTAPRKHFAFYGPMGIGKTTFIKALCRKLRAQVTVTSPTFALVNEYPIPGGDMIYHFDFYRINRTEEVFDFGAEEYFERNSYCFVEWPEKAEAVLPDDVVRVSMTLREDGARVLAFNL